MAQHPWQVLATWTPGHRDAGRWTQNSGPPDTTWTGLMPNSVSTVHAVAHSKDIGRIGWGHGGQLGVGKVPQVAFHLSSLGASKCVQHFLLTGDVAVWKECCAAILH